MSAILFNNSQGFVEWNVKNSFAQNFFFAVSPARTKFKLFFQPASQPAQRAQARAHGPGPDPGPMGQGHGPGPGPMDRAIISEAAKAADFKGGCGGAEPSHMKKVQTFFRLSKQSRVILTALEHLA